MEKKKVPRDMTAIHKKFEEKKIEEINKVEERFAALLKEEGLGEAEAKPEEKGKEGG